MCSDPLSNMDSDARHVVVEEFDFAAMKTCPDLDAECVHPIAKRARASDGPSRPVKGRKDTIAGRLHPSTSEPVYFTVNERVVSAEKFAPPSVSQVRGLTGRVDNVGEQNRR